MEFLEMFNDIDFCVIHYQLEKNKPFKRGILLQKRNFKIYGVDGMTMPEAINEILRRCIEEKAAYRIVITTEASSIKTGKLLEWKRESIN